MQGRRDETLRLDGSCIVVESADEEAALGSRRVGEEGNMVEERWCAQSTYWL